MIMSSFHVRRLIQVLSGLVFLIIELSDLKAAEQPIGLKPEKTRLEVGTAGSGTTSLPLFVAFEAGYFSKRGLNVSVNQVGATVAVQGVISGTIDIYQGGTDLQAGLFRLETDRLFRCLEIGQLNYQKH